MKSVTTGPGTSLLPAVLGSLFGARVSFDSASGRITTQVSPDTYWVDAMTILKNRSQCATSVVLDLSPAYMEVSPKDSNEENYRKSFQARVFGLFYEKLLEVWFEAHEYQSKGRPSAYDPHSGRWTRWTYDLYVEDGGKGYVVEAKSYPAFWDGRWKVLTHKILEGHWDPKAFEEFLRPDFIRKWAFKVDGKKVTPAGKILVWWDFDDGEVSRISQDYGIDRILSIRRILDELRSVKSDRYAALIEYYRSATESLFESLQG